MDDLISRQAAIDAIENINPSVAWLDYAADVIKALPPAQPEIIRCKDCKYRDSDDFCTGRGYPNMLVSNDGFCDKGERRKNRTDE